MAETTVVKAADSGFANLEAFEKAVYGRQHDPEKRLDENGVAMNALLQCLLALSKGATFEGHGHCGPALSTRMAAAITALFLDPAFRLNEAGINTLAGFRPVIEAVYRASAFDGSDHVISLVQEAEEGCDKYLLLMSMDSKLDFDFEQTFREHPQELFGLYLSLIGYGQVLTPEADDRREKLLAIADVFEHVELKASLLNVFASAYMHVSYAHGRDKHAPKRVFHSIMSRFMHAIVDVNPNSRTYVAHLKPVILVPLEWWTDKHAMYRCYAPSIRQLRQDFHLIGMGMSPPEEPSTKVFHEWIQLNNETMTMQDIVRQVQGISPDMIYFPSIGMAQWVIALASLRLAPKQVMTYGHPATSMSPEIDYGILESDLVVKDRFSEEIYPLPPGTIQFASLLKGISTKHVPRETDTVKIAVAAMQVKVTWPFIQAMQEVQKRCSKRIEFHFYSAVTGIGMYSFGRLLQLQLDNTMIHEHSDYPTYLEKLAGCDICLFSFPFGGANTVIDAMALGIPMVSLEGDEPHSRTDSTLMRRAGMPEHWIAKDVDSYIMRVVQLVESDDERLVSSETINDHFDIENFCGADRGDAFLHAFRQIHGHVFAKKERVA